MLLRAFDLGLGSCFVGYAGLVNDDREILRSLGVLDSQELFCQLIFGYAKKLPKPKDREPNVQKTID